MIDTRRMTPMQLRHTGLEVLTRELGPVGMVRFLHLFETGQGNYSLNRHEWLGRLTVDEIAESIQKRRQSPAPSE